MKIAFFGTPDFAIPSLRALFESPKHEVVCVVAQPDKPSGRGGSKIPPSKKGGNRLGRWGMSPVKQFAIDNNIPVFQPEKISNPESLRDFTETISRKPDVIVTCAFGQILKQNPQSNCQEKQICKTPCSQRWSNE